MIVMDVEKFHKALVKIIENREGVKITYTVEKRNKQPTNCDNDDNIEGGSCDEGEYRK